MFRFLNRWRLQYTLCLIRWIRHRIRWKFALQNFFPCNLLSEESIAQYPALDKQHLFVSHLCVPFTHVGCITHDLYVSWLSIIVSQFWNLDNDIFRAHAHLKYVPVNHNCIPICASGNDVLSEHVHPPPSTPPPDLAHEQYSNTKSTVDTATSVAFNSAISICKT